jgi:flavin reductase (DIM6/NTAB) family NADH-FMN oxidoreductase RutF
MQVEIPFDEAIIRKYPEQIVIVLVKEKSGRVNPITVGWTMLTSHIPPMMAFSVGNKRYSLEILKEARDFVIAFPSEEQKEAALLFGTKSGRDTDKLNISELSTVPASIVDCVLLSDAVANFECSKERIIPTGDHMIVVGKILASHVNTEPVKRIYNVGKGFKLAGISVKDS